MLRQSLVVLALAATMVGFSANTAGCDKEQVVYQRPVAELNQKAQQLMNEGQPQAAIGRLESALDLMPNEPTTQFNLAIAYQQNQQYDQALAVYQGLLKSNPQQKPTILKSMGIVYEAMGDDLIAKSQAEPAPPPPKLSDADVKKLEGRAIDQYNLARQYYEEALPNAKNPGELQAQIENLKVQVQQIKDGKASIGL